MKYLKLSVFIGVIFICLSVSSIQSKIFALTPSFEDDFSSGSSMWSADSPNWNVVNEEYGIEIFSGRSASFPVDSVWDYSWKNIIFEVDVRGVQGVDRTIMAKYVNDENFVGIHKTTNKINLEQRVNDVGSVLDSNFQDYLVNGTKHNLKIHIMGNYTKVYLDNIPDPILESADSLPLNSNWKVGFRIGVGNGNVSEVYFDNVKVTLLPEEDEADGVFELPFLYEGRDEGDREKFEDEFLSRYTSLFDHDPAKNSFTNFMGDEYDNDQCDTAKEACYNSHNGVDFDDATDSDDAYPVADGEVLYRSEDNNGKGNNKCKPEPGGYGCVVLMKHDTDMGTYYGLYAHLKEIYLGEDTEFVSYDEAIGKMGNTGRSSGVHLHFSTLVSTEELLPLTLNKKIKTKETWKNLVSQITSNNLNLAKEKKSVCSYKLDGTTYAYLDPNGWNSDEVDPWSAAKDDGGCEVSSTNLWKYKIELE